jgi:hypothetical protein
MATFRESEGERLPLNNLFLIPKLILYSSMKKRSPIITTHPLDFSLLEQDPRDPTASGVEIYY